MRLTSFALTLTCALGLASQSLLAQTVNDWRFAHPRSTLVGGIRAAALLQSPLLKLTMEQARGVDPSVGVALAMMQTVFRGVTDIRFSLLDNGSPTPESLILVSGVLDPSTLAMFRGQMETHALDANTLLIGAGASLRDAVARLGQTATPAELQSVAFLQAGQITPGHDLWIAGQLPNIPGIPLPEGLNASVRGFAVGISFNQNIAVEASVLTDSAAQAEALVNMVRASEANQPAGTPRSETSVNGATARLRMSLPADQVMQALQNPALSGLLGPQGAAQPALPPPPKPAPAKPRRNTVIIEGLEGGPLEIPIEVRPGVR